MEICSLQTPAVISSIPRSNLTESKFVRGRIIRLPNSKRCPYVCKFRFPNSRAQASGAAKLTSEASGEVALNTNLKDENLVFVAGATGRVGSRTVRELLKLGFGVRAGVRSVQRAESLVQSVKEMKLDKAASEGIEPIQKLEIVECDLEKGNLIGPALGNASIVICCIGASEKEVFDITGPYRIDYQATKNLIDAATIAKVNHFILVTSLGTNKVGFPAAILNLFWGVLVWKRKAEEVLLACGLPYTIVRPGGMERPTDSYKETHNITLSQEDTLFGGQVSNLQVAELMAVMAKNPRLSYCKIVEVVAETAAPLTPMADLLQKIPSQRADFLSSKQSGALDGLEPSKSFPKSSGTSLPKGKAVTISPLSPYIMYEDLKPPTSPTPTPSTTTAIATIADISSGTSSIVSEKEVKAERKETSPLSPYTNYEDLKPPSSPSPIPSGKKETTINSTTPTGIASQIYGSNDVLKMKSTTVVNKDPPQAMNSRHSPYLVYDDLKPPTSPTPEPRK